MKRTLLVFFLISMFLLSSLAFADTTQKDWKVLTSFDYVWNKVDASTALSLTLEYDKFFSDSTIIFGGVSIDYYLTTPVANDTKTFINPFVGVDYKVSKVTTLEARIDYDVRAKAPIIKIGVVWEW